MKRHLRVCRKTTAMCKNLLMRALFLWKKRARTRVATLLPVRWVLMPRSMLKQTHSLSPLVPGMCCAATVWSMKFPMPILPRCWSVALLRMKHRKHWSMRLMLQVGATTSRSLWCLLHRHMQRLLCQWKRLHQYLRPLQRQLHPHPRLQRRSSALAQCCFGVHLWALLLQCSWCLLLMVALVTSLASRATMLWC